MEPVQAGAPASSHDDPAAGTRATSAGFFLQAADAVNFPPHELVFAPGAGLGFYAVHFAALTRDQPHSRWLWGALVAAQLDDPVKPFTTPRQDVPGGAVRDGLRGFGWRAGRGRERRGGCGGVRHAPHRVGGGCSDPVAPLGRYTGRLRSPQRLVRADVAT